MINNIEWIFSDEPVNKSEIRKIGKEMGVIFPNDYIECAAINHGAHPNPEVFDIKGRPECVFNRLLSYDPISKSYILGIYKSTRDRLAHNVIPFANDPFGNMICFFFKEEGTELGSIVFWDHETSGDGKYAGVSYICNSFTKLLSMLYTPNDNS
jgi:hypothetical protein